MTKKVWEISAVEDLHGTLSTKKWWHPVREGDTPEEICQLIARFYGDGWAVGVIAEYELTATHPEWLGLSGGTGCEPGCAVCAEAGA